MPAVGENVTGLALLLTRLDHGVRLKKASDTEVLNRNISTDGYVRIDGETS